MQIEALQVAYSIEIVQYVRVFQNALVGIETVDTDTDVEDQVFESELVLEVTGHIDGLLGTNRAIKDLIRILMVEEIVE